MPWTDRATALPKQRGTWVLRSCREPHISPPPPCLVLMNQRDSTGPAFLLLLWGHPRLCNTFPPLNYSGAAGAVSHLLLWSNCQFFDCLRVGKLLQTAGRSCEGEMWSWAECSRRARLEAVEQEGFWGCSLCGAEQALSLCAIYEHKSIKQWVCFPPLGYWCQ